MGMGIFWHYYHTTLPFICVTIFVDHNLTDGQEAHINWPGSSPDLTLRDLFFFGVSSEKTSFKFHMYCKKFCKTTLEHRIYQLFKSVVSIFDYIFLVYTRNQLISIYVTSARTSTKIYFLKSSSFTSAISCNPTFTFFLLSSFADVGTLRVIQITVKIYYFSVCYFVPRLILQGCYLLCSILYF